MSEIIEKINKKQNLFSVGGCTELQLKIAQTELQLNFPDEYREYVENFGCISFESTEWTGLNIEGRLNTVTATQTEKELNSDFPQGFFVLENLGIDGKIIIMNEAGEVYLLQKNQKVLIAASLAEYIDNL